MISPDALIDVVSTYLGVDKSFVDIMSTFEEDFAISEDEKESLRRVVCSRFKIKIPAEDWNTFESLEEIVEYAQEQEG